MNRKKEHNLLVIIPAYNEETTLPGCLKGLFDCGVDKIADILVINDASTDNTKKAAINGGAQCISLIYNLGYGNALQTGYKYASQMDYDYIIQMDSDGQHDPCNISKIYEALKTPDENGYPDIVLGSRFLEGSGEYNPGLIRSFGFKWFKFIIFLLGRKKIADATTGLQGLSARAFHYYEVFDHFDAKYPDANMILQMILLGYNVRQIPAVMHTRSVGKGMHSGIWSPIKYMFRSTIAAITIWIRIKIEGK